MPWCFCRIILRIYTCHWSRMLISLSIALCWCLLLLGIHYSVSFAWESKGFLSFFIWGWMNLPLSSSIKALRWVHCSFLIHFFIMFVRGRWKLHIVTKLLFRLSLVLLWENSHFPIIFNYFITKENFLNNFIIWSWMLKEHIIHFTASRGIYT